MADHFYAQGPRGTHPPRTPLPRRQHSRQSSQLGEKLFSAMDLDGSQSRKRFPESLHFNPGSLRSRTESTRSSISSAHIPDSATTYSVSTLASPLSSSYASDIQERFAAYSIDGPARIRHRHQPSNATTCSTFINDDSEVPLHLDYASKIRDLLDDPPESIDLSETPPVE